MDARPSATAELGAPARTAYVLPIRWTQPEPIDELGEYLQDVAGWVDDVVVVDGSPPEIFERHHAAWSQHVCHLRPAPRFRCAYGKVHGVLTGLAVTNAERVVIADDDVRYDRAALDRVLDLLGDADLVRPQNFFSPAPWHAQWDTARTLLNRAAGGDFPGTLAVRRSTFWANDGYDGDVLFENLELMRTVTAGGGRIVTPLDCYVARQPPTTKHFFSQRVRQAYDEFARPGRLVASLAVVPAVGLLAQRRQWRTLGALAAGAVAVAEVGRCRAGGRRIFSPIASVLAPVWILERAACAWLALYQRARHGGVVYGDIVLRRAANPARELRRRAALRGSRARNSVGAEASGEGSWPGGAPFVREPDDRARHRAGVAVG
jgi:hypothetical protein